MENPATPQKSPYKVIVEKDKIYFWCAWRQSKKQPFCDGTHNKDGKYKSIKYLKDLNFLSFLWVPSQKGCLRDRPQAHQK